jgi:hypothetical protein
MSMKQMVVGVVKSPSEAESIVHMLRDASFRESDISVLLSERRPSRPTGEDRGRRLIVASGAGALVSALALLAGAGGLAVPGLAALLRAGPVLAALRGAQIGVTLATMGGPESKADESAGVVLLSVRVDGPGDLSRAEAIFRAGGAGDVWAAARF